MRKLGVGLGVALVTIALAALAVATTGTAAPSAKKAPIKAAWIYVGPHNDGGWSQAHDNGPAVRPEGDGRERDHDLQGERPRGAAGLPGDRQPRP